MAVKKKAKKKATKAFKDYGWSGSIRRKARKATKKVKRTTSTGARYIKEAIK